MKNTKADWGNGEKSYHYFGINYFTNGRMFSTWRNPTNMYTLSYMLLRLVVIIFILAALVLFSFNSFSQSYFLLDGDLNCITETKICPVTGKELVRIREKPSISMPMYTYNYCNHDDGKWLTFSTGKYVDAGLYEDIEPEFDSLMQAAFDGYFSLLLEKYAADRQKNQEAINERKRKEKRVEILMAEIGLARLKGEEPSPEHIENLCLLAEELSYWSVLYDYCNASRIFMIQDSTMIYRE